MPRWSRRSVLAAVASGCGGSGAGCLRDSTTLSVLAAGSLASLLDTDVGPAFERATDIEYTGEYHGSTAVMRMVESGQKHPDVVLSADHQLLRDRLYPTHAAWDLTIASNALGLAYAPSTQLGQQLAAGVPWYEAVRTAPPGALAISDPSLDPLGYRAVLAFRLAAAKHGLEDFAAPTISRAYREPEEPRLLAGVEAGNRAAAVAYQNMAVARDLPFYRFPPAYSFADPNRADTYASVSYTTADGYTAVGAPITYAATVLTTATNPAAGRRFVRFLTDARDRLRDHGFTVEAFPRTHGPVPATAIPTDARSSQTVST